MVVTEHFAWAHMGKTGGDATAKMFAAVPGLVEWASSPSSDAKHDPFRAQAGAVSGRLRVMNIRRLPSWVLSRAHHIRARGPWPGGRRHFMPTAEEMAGTFDADNALRRMSDGPRFPIQRWLRQEFLADDVAALLEHFGLLTESARRGIASVPYRARSYDHDLASTFTASQIHRMYRLNPGWAEVERRVYGGLYDLTDPRFADPPPDPAPARLSRLAGRSRRRSDPGHRRPDRSLAAAGARPGDCDRIDFGDRLAALAGTSLDEIDRRLAEEGPSLANYRLFRGLDDRIWALLLSRRYTTYLSILETLPHVPEPTLQEGRSEGRGLTLLGRSSSLYGHIRSMQAAHGIGGLPTARILDFGCGWGRMTRFFCRDVDPGCLHACDHDEELLRICLRSRLPAVLHRTGLPPAGLPEGDFDLAYSPESFAGMEEAAADTSLAALHESLRPGGLLVLAIGPPAPPGRQNERPRKAPVGLPHLRERWAERFEIVDVTVPLEDLDRVAVTLRRI